MNPLLMPGLRPAPHIKPMINVGALFDVANGEYIEGTKGQMILNGGMAGIVGVVGIGNNFKSTILRFLTRTAMSRIPGSTGSTYDTEVNTHEGHLKHQASLIEGLGSECIYENGRWVITDKTQYSGNEWYKEMRTWQETKIKEAAKIMVKTPFWNREHTKAMEIIQPTFGEIDSFSEFETDDVTAMQLKNELGDSGGNTIHMRQGLAKVRVLMEMPRLCLGSYHYLGMTAHLGKETTMQNMGPAGSVPIVKLKHLKNGDKIKGTTDKFTFITHDCYNCYDASPMINQGTKTVEYPRNADDDLLLDTDLNTVKIRNLRSKSGVSGMTIILIVSQNDGVLPALTEFHHIKENDRFGLEGSNISYSLSIYPDVKLGRTTVRGKLEEDPVLRRAVQITSELCQITNLYRNLPEGLLCTPRELYSDLKAKGYDWSVLLNTRGWWTINEDEQPDLLPYLSVMDLLRMRKGEYHPYWLPGLNKTLEILTTPRAGAAAEVLLPLAEGFKQLAAETRAEKHQSEDVGKKKKASS